MPALYTSQVFPGGQEKTLDIGATAGNVTTNLSPGVGLRWVIQRGRIVVTPDITVVNRYVDLITTDGTNITEDISSTPAIVASTTHITAFGEGIIAVGGALGANSYTGLQNLVIDGIDQFRITLRAGVAGDSYSGRVVVREMAVN